MIDNGQLTKTIILHSFDAIFKSQNVPNSNFSLGELTTLRQTS